MNKSVVIALTVIVSLLCIYQLSFTFKARSVQKEATEYATDKKGILDQKKKQKYLDSLWNKPVYNLLGYEYTYKDVKSKELALGLDLQGGMHVTLEVSPVEILKAMSGNSTDAKFLEAIKLAEKNQKNSQSNFMDLFASAYNTVAPNGKLSRIFTNTSNKGKITFNSTNAEVLDIVRGEVNDAIDRSFNIVRTRIDKFGVANPNIMKLPGTGRILVELPGVDNPARVRKLLSGVAKLEFWEVWETQELLPYLEQFNNYVQKEDEKNKLKNGKTSEKENSLIASDSSKKTDDNSLVASDDKKEEPQIKAKDSTDNSLVANADTSKGKGDTLKKDDKTAQKKDTAKTKIDSTKNQLANFLLLPSQEGFTVKLTDTARVNTLLNKSEVKSLFPSNVKFCWDVKGDEKAGIITLYAIKKGRGGKAPLEGDVIVEARQDFDNNQPDVSMQMNAVGAKAWKKLTGSNIGRRVAIVLDDYVYSAPRVNGEIPTGSSQISGNFTIDEAKDLANVLKSGKLPAPTRIVEEATVGPSLGLESINQGLLSMLIGLGVVVLFMFLYYRSSGLIADIALVFNIFFIIGILAQFGAVLTLAGLAGIVLTIGMSVDANVLIFERIKEEMRNGKSLKAAIDLGYSKAYSSIIDGNATTFLIAAILYSFGSGGVKGFAITLMIGIICSLFTAIFITRLIIEYFTRKADSKAIRFDGLVLNNLFRGANYNFIKMRKPAYIFSSAFIVLSLLVAVGRGGLNLGVDFKGGRSYVVAFDSPIAVNEARNEVSKQFEGSTEVKTFGGNNKLKITTTYLIGDESSEADKKVEAQLLKGLEKFKSKKPEIVSFSKVGATIADDIANTAYLTIIASLLVIFVYILARFSKWQYGAGAVIALFHDVLFVIGGMAIANVLGVPYEVDQVFIAAVLTVIGYSINDTVVVFDRIREFAGDTDNRNYAEKMNAAINDTLSRTIMTSGTTLMVVVALFLFGGQVLGAFSFSLLVGIGMGTYSSIFIAAPIVLDISLLQQKRKTNNPINTAKA